MDDIGRILYEQYRKAWHEATAQEPDQWAQLDENDREVWRKIANGFREKLQQY